NPPTPPCTANSWSGGWRRPFCPARSVRGSPIPSPTLPGCLRRCTERCSPSCAAVPTAPPPSKPAGRRSRSASRRCRTARGGYRGLARGVAAVHREDDPGDVPRFRTGEEHRCPRDVRGRGERAERDPLRHLRLGGLRVGLFLEPFLDEGRF